MRVYFDGRHPPTFHSFDVELKAKSTNSIVKSSYYSVSATEPCHSPSRRCLKPADSAIMNRLYWLSKEENLCPCFKQLSVLVSRIFARRVKHHDSRSVNSVSPSSLTSFPQIYIVVLGRFKLGLQLWKEAGSQVYPTHSGHLSRFPRNSKYTCIITKCPIFLLSQIHKMPAVDLLCIAQHSH
jgi:hypothetical protein